MKHSPLLWWEEVAILDLVMLCPRHLRPPSRSAMWWLGLRASHTTTHPPALPKVRSPSPLPYFLPHHTKSTHTSLFFISFRLSLLPFYTPSLFQATSIQATFHPASSAPSPSFARDVVRRLFLTRNESAHIAKPHSPYPLHRNR